ncbi:MAG: hypothetical protein WBD56_03600, partial [Anaerolineales bacterium]
KQLAERNVKLEFKTSNWRSASTVSYFATITNDDGEGLDMQRTDAVSKEQMRLKIREHGDCHVATLLLMT